MNREYIDAETLEIINADKTVQQLHIFLRNLHELQGQYKGKTKEYIKIKNAIQYQRRKLKNREEQIKEQL